MTGLYWARCIFLVALLLVVMCFVALELTNDRRR